MIEDSECGIILQVYIQPGAKKNEIIGLHNGALKIKIQSPPEDGKANDALVDFVAKTLNISAKQVSLISGLKSRNKKILIEGPDKQDLLIKFSKLGYS
jgi:uncharacterized protein (TIGR00251 family)